MNISDGVLEIIKQCMFLYYGDKETKAEVDNLPDTKSRKKRKVESESPDKDQKAILQGTSADNGDEECVNTEEDAWKNSVSVENKILSENNHNIDSTENIRLASDWEMSQPQLNIDYELCLKRDNNFETIEENNPTVNGNEYNNIQISTFKNYSENMKNNVNVSKSNLKVDKFEDNLQLFTSENDVRCKDNCSKKLKDGDLSSFVINSKSNIENTNLSFSVWKQKNSTVSLKGNNNETIRNGKEINDTSSTLDRFLDKSNVSLVHKNVESNHEDDMIFENTKPTFENSSRVEKASVEMSSPTLSQWSRGEVITSSGVEIKGSSVLTNSPAVSSQISQGPSERSVSSQMGCKEMSAFTKFARNIRKEILAEHPNMSFTRVAQQLQVQWRHLNENEKNKYKETVNVAKDHTLHGASKKSTSLLTNVIDKKEPDIELEVNMDMLRQMAKTSMIKEKNEIHLVGQLESSPLWLYCSCSTDLTVLSVLRLMEAVKFHQYLTNFSVPAKLLDHFIPVVSRDVGDSQWKVLLALERSPNGVIKDNRLVNNGFYVEVIEGEIEAHLLYVPQNISYCGLEELKDILELIQKHGSEASLMQCRPLKVISFIRSEVMRECSQEEQPTDPEKISDLLGYWLSHVAPHCQSCIHHEPITHPLDNT